MSYKILVTGTPGVGKTTLSKHMKKVLGCKMISLSDLIEKKKLYSNRCAKYDTLEYDPEKVEKYLRKKLKKGESYIFDTHDPESVSFIRFDAIIVLSADTYVLSERYDKRGYNKIKADENIQVEIMEVIYNEVIENICEDSEEIDSIIRIETVKDRKSKPVEEIYKEIEESSAWKDLVKTKAAKEAHA
ncbi:adenylate kinase [Nematocida minor]|uniref:adenylate kinase n=1 Tax=Nematocida minor TaxID=1912983 RepID=UPI00221FC5AF|nr:adenylate kinase [Nematocida minor]KAI5190020.1 adenylate kinase [Nematocida minor]